MPGETELLRESNVINSTTSLREYPRPEDNLSLFDNDSMKASFPEESGGRVTCCTVVCVNDEKVFYYCDINIILTVLILYLVLFIAVYSVLH